MKRIAVLLIGALGFGGAAAQAQDLPNIDDTDGNGVWSLAELQTAYPTLTDEVFAAINANGDAGVDAAELTTAIAEGKLPTK